MLTGPPGARPTNAATAVPTPSMGFFPLVTSSTYTPGVRYVGMLLLGLTYTSSRRAPPAPAGSTNHHVHPRAGHGHARLALEAGDGSHEQAMGRRRYAGEPEAAGKVAGRPRAGVRHGDPGMGDRLPMLVAHSAAEAMELLHAH